MLYYLPKNAILILVHLRQINENLNDNESHASKQFADNSVTKTSKSQIETFDKQIASYI